MPTRPISPIRRDLPRWAFATGVAAVAVLQIALIATHDYFVDEWQALQIATQSPNLAALLENLRYEGHPPLWYLLLRGLAAIFGPGGALAAASLVCALATLFLLAARAPVPRWARLTMILAEPILFEYGTVSRGASLGVALTFAALALWHRRRAVWAVLALVPLVDFLFGVIALALIFLRWSERAPAWYPGLALFALCSILAGWSVFPASDFISVYRPSPPFEMVARWVTEMAVVALPFQWDDGPRWDAPWVTPLTPVLAAAFLILCYHQTRRRPAERLVAVGFPLFLLAFMLFVHILAIRHVMLAAVVFLAVLWRQGAAKLPIGAPAAFWLAGSALCGLVTAGFALTRPFDTAPEVARVIRALRLEEETWLSFPAQHGQGVSALSGILFEGSELYCRQSFVRWNFRHQLTDPQRLRKWLDREAARGGSFYLLTQHHPAPGPAAQHLVTVPPGLDGKVYHLYRVPGAGTGRRPAAAPCVPGIRPLPPLGARDLEPGFRLPMQGAKGDAR